MLFALKGIKLQHEERKENEETGSDIMRESMKERKHSQRPNCKTPSGKEEAGRYDEVENATWRSIR